MSEVKVKEIQEFVNDFNKKIKESFKIYENRNKKEKSLRRNFSEINGEIKMREKFPSLFIKNEENKNSIKNLQLNNKSPIWKPPNGAPNYFEEFKRLDNKHELSNWEKVSNY